MCLVRRVYRQTCKRSMKSIRFQIKCLGLTVLLCLCVTGCGKKDPTPQTTEGTQEQTQVPVTQTYFYDYFRVNREHFSIWESPEKFEQRLGDVWGRCTGNYILGGTAEAGFYYMGTDYSIPGVVRTSYAGTGAVTAFADLKEGVSLDTLLSTVDVTLLPGQASSMRYGLLVANETAVAVKPYETYYDAIASDMLYPNSTFTLAQLRQALALAENDRQRWYITGRMALLSDVMNGNLSRLLEITFEVDNENKISRIVYTCYVPQT